MFNAFKYAKKLEDAGVTREQAEAHVQIITDIVEDNLATKDDVKDIKQEFKEVRSEMEKLEYRMTIKVGAIVVTVISLAVAVIKLF